MSTKVLFTFEAEDLGVAKKQEEISDRLKAIRREIEASKRSGSPYGQLLKESVSLKREQTELRKRQQELNREFAATKVPKDSIAGLRLEYSKLISQIEKLDSTQRNSTFGRNLIAQAATAKQKINEMEAQVGRFTGNVGNYKLALKSIGDSLTGGLLTGGIAAGALALTKVMEIGIKAAIEYEKALSDLSALTGLKGEDLDNLEKIARSLQNIDVGGGEIVKKGPEILNALKLVGGARPELLKDAEALGEVTRQAIVLSQASGDDLETSVKSLTTIMGQFGLTAKDTNRVINELAAGAKEGAAEIPDITDALQKAGAVAKISNVSTAESVALVELLADKQLKGAEAGTQLRNVLVKIASADALPRKAQQEFQRLNVDINTLKDTTIPFEKRLLELSKVQGDLTALTNIFGVENLQAAAIITSGIPKYQQLADAVQGTNEAYVQAETRSDNLATKIDNLSAKTLNRLEEKFSSTTSGVSAFVGVLDFLVEKVDLVGFAFEAAEKALLGPLSGFKKFKEQVVGIINLFKKEEDGAPGAFFDISGIEDDTDKLLKTIVLAGDGVSDATEDTAVNIEFLRKRIKDLKSDLEKAPVGSALFKDLSTQLKEAKKELDTALGDAGSKKIARPTEAKALEGSVQFFREQVRLLQTEVEKTPTSSPLIDGLLKKLKEAERQLYVVESQLKELRNPTVQTSEFDQANAGLAQLGVSIDTKGSKDKAQQQLEALAISLAESVGVTLTVDIDNSVQAKLDALENEINARRLTREQEHQDRVNQSIVQGAVDSAQNVANAVFQVRRNELEQYQTFQLEKLNEQERVALDKAAGNAVKEKAIREDFEKKRAALEREGAKKRKEIARKEALINTALAITKALTGAPPPFSFVLAGVAAIAGAAQLAAINSQEFWQGGKVKRLGSGKIRERQNAPRTAHGDTVLAYLAPGEMVLNEQQQNRITRIAGRGIFAKAGVPGTASATPMPHFASGGVVGDIVPQTSAYNYSSSGGASISATFSDQQIERIGVIVGAEVGAVVGAEVRSGIGIGLNDANRRLEREAQLETIRQG